MPPLYQMVTKMEHDIRGCQIVDFIVSHFSGVPLLNEILMRLVCQSHMVDKLTMLHWLIVRVVGCCCGCELCS